MMGDFHSSGSCSVYEEAGGLEYDTICIDKQLTTFWRYPEDGGGSKLLQNAGKCVPVCMMSYTRRLESSCLLLTTFLVQHAFNLQSLSDF